MKKIQTNVLNDEAKHSLLKRVITGLVIAAVSIPCIIFGGWFYFALTAVIAILASVEITHVTDLKGTLKVVISVITTLLVIAIVYYVLYHNLYSPVSGQLHGITGEILSDNLNKINISVMIIILMAAIYFVICFITPDFSVKHVLYLVTMTLVVAIGIQSIITLRYSPMFYFTFDNMTNGETVDVNSNLFKYGQSTFLLAYVVIGVIMNDIGAYLIGIFFGRHKMNERISPKKTWEGFIGGVVFSLISSTVFAILVTYNDLPMLPIFNFKSSNNPYALFFIIGISILLPLLSDVGDFTFSAIKRFWGVKDFSGILPGHGGILDRIDSLIFASALVSCLIIFIEFFFYPGGAMPL